MDRRVHCKEPVTKHSYGLQIVRQCCLVCSYVNTVSQSAHHDQIGMPVCKRSYYVVAQFPAARCCISCADHAQYFGTVEVAIAFEKEHYRRVIALSESERVIIVEIEEGFDIMFNNIFFFFFSYFKVRPVADVFCQSRSDAGYFHKVPVRFLKYGVHASEMRHKFSGTDVTNAWNKA